MLTRFKLYECSTDEDASNGLIDSRGNLNDPFVIPSIMFIFKCMKHSTAKDDGGDMSERLTSARGAIETTAYGESYQYLPGGEEWTKF